MTKVGNKFKMMLGAVLLFVGAMGFVLPVGAAIDCTGLTAAQCAQKGATDVDPEKGEGVDLMGTVNTIINIIIFVVGLLAVVMIIMGGIKYTTSQGDAAKVKSAKDTIMYGIIGLVVALLAFAIVNFVLTSVFTTA